MKKLLSIIFLLYFFYSPHSIFGQAGGLAKNISERFCQITSSSEWKLAKTIKLNFPTFHPQGMLKIGDVYFLSAVQTIVKPQKYNSLQNGYDRSTGKGIGHLFTFNESGDLIAQANLGDSITYHPGGIDFDGKYIWAPVSEYRPNSRSLIYRIDPATLNFEQIFPFNDSIGALACDSEKNRLIGANWGARQFYLWKINFHHQTIKINKDNAGIPNFQKKLNGSFYIDYQDCHFVGNTCMLCGGLKHFEIDGIGKFTLGGLDLINLNSFLPVYQVPIKLFVHPGLVMSNNPFFVEAVGELLRFYFVPEDDNSQLYIYNVTN